MGQKFAFECPSGWDGVLGIESLFAFVDGEAGSQPENEAASSGSHLWM